MSPIDDSQTVRIEVSDRFRDWREGLRDHVAKAKIATRLFALERGHWGDVRPVGEGVSEMRIHSGPGYRLYLTQRDAAWVVLLCGGDKDSQARDVATAKMMAREMKHGD